MSESPSDASESAPKSPPSMPGGVKTAGVLWVIVGAFLILVTLGGWLAGIVAQTEQPERAKSLPTDGCQLQLGLAIGAGILIAGLRVARGSATDVLIVSVLSIILALLNLLFGIMSLRVADRLPPKAPPGLEVMLTRTGATTIAIGCGLLLPAGLALAGRSRYREWQAATRAIQQQKRRERREQWLAELAQDPRYPEAVRLVYRAVNASPRLPSGVPDPEEVRRAFESGFWYLVAAGVPADEARTNLRRLIEADAARGNPIGSNSEAETKAPLDPDRPPLSGDS